MNLSDAIRNAQDDVLVRLYKKPYFGHRSMYDFFTRWLAINYGIKASYYIYSKPIMSSEWEIHAVSNEEWLTMFILNYY